MPTTSGAKTYLPRQGPLGLSQKILKSLILFLQLIDPFLLLVQHRGLSIVFRDKLLVLVVDSVPFPRLLPQPSDLLPQLCQLSLLIAYDPPLSLVIGDDLVELFESDFNHGQALL